jgi:hypothetical protein
MNKSRFVAICSVIAMAYSATAQTVMPKEPNETLRVFPLSSASIPLPDFLKLREVLLKETNVPLRLPTFLPYIDAADPVAASLVSTSSSSYEIWLGWGDGCFSAEVPQGAGACHYGAIRGSAGALTEDEGRRVPVTLAGGIHGYYVGFTCGSHCGDGAIGWTQGGYHYSISLKAGSKKELIKVANSAIAQPHDRILVRKN